MNFAGLLSNLSSRSPVLAMSLQDILIVSKAKLAFYLRKVKVQIRYKIRQKTLASIVSFFFQIPHKLWVADVLGLVLRD